MFKICSIILFTFLISCNSKNNNNLNNSIDSTHLFTEELKSYNIKGFMSFNDQTTLDTLSFLLRSQNIDYTINPELTTHPTLHSYYLFIVMMDCPFVKFIYVPRLKLEEFNFKNLVFAFYRDSLIFLSINEENQYSDEEISKLKSYYEMKYGKTKNTLPYEDRFQWDYYNRKDNIHVSFSREEIQKTYRPDLTKGDPIFLDKFNISFKNYIEVFDKCMEYRTQERNKKEQIEKQKEQKILDKL